jgi:hypothetical protein
VKEDDVYLKALGVLDAALDGKTVNPIALSTAISMFSMLWMSVHSERLKKEQIKDALREVWEETLEEKKNDAK